MSGNYALKRRAVCSKRSEYTDAKKKINVNVRKYIIQSFLMSEL